MMLKLKSAKFKWLCQSCRTIQMTVLKPDRGRVYSAYLTCAYCDRESILWTKIELKKLSS